MFLLCACLLTIRVTFAQYTPLTSPGIFVDGSGTFVTVSVDIDISTNTMAMGAYFGRERGSNTGVVFVYTRSSPTTSWVQQQRLLGSVSNQWFGRSVAVEGNTLAVGADHDGATNAGAVFIFTRNGTVWTQFQKLISFSPEADDYYGRSVALEGDLLVVGADYDNGVYPTYRKDSGGAYVYVRNVNSGAWQYKWYLSTSDWPRETDRMGGHVSISGNTIAVSMAARVSSAVEIFTRNRTSERFPHQQRIATPTHNYASVSGDVLAVGLSLLSTPEVRVYTRSGTTWTLAQTLMPGDGARNSFGSSVSVGGNGDVIVVGASSDATKAFEAGAAYIFERTNGAWAQTQKIVPADGNSRSWFGESMAVSSNGRVFVTGGSSKAWAFASTKTDSPTFNPSASPSKVPSKSPLTSIPSQSPVSSEPTLIPSISPSRGPTQIPISSSPSVMPTTSAPIVGTRSPSTTSPSTTPTANPSRSPTSAPLTSSPTSGPMTSSPTSSKKVTANATSTTGPTNLPTKKLDVISKSCELSMKILLVVIAVLSWQLL